MKSIKDIYKIGKGPSSSHTMGPAKAMSIYVGEHPEAESYLVVLYGSLADTGEGHGTDKAIRSATDKAVEIIFNTVENTMDIYSVVGGERCEKMRVMSVGGGDIEIEGREDEGASDVYPESSFTAIAEFCKANEMRLSDYVFLREGEGIREFLFEVWEVMKRSIHQGLSTSGILPGGLEVEIVAGFASDGGIDGEFIAAAVDGNFIVAVVLSDKSVNLELTVKFSEIADVVDRFLELADETRCK